MALGDTNMAKGKHGDIFKDDVDPDDRFWNNVPWNGEYLHREREECVDRFEGRDKDLLDYSHYYRSAGGVRSDIQWRIAEQRIEYVYPEGRKDF
jgi:hypothetical protein